MTHHTIDAADESEVLDRIANEIVMLVFNRGARVSTLEYNTVRERIQAVMMGMLVATRETA